MHWELCTLIFLPNVDIFIAAFPRSCSRARKLCFSVISEITIEITTILCGYLDQRRETFLTFTSI